MKKVVNKLGMKPSIAYTDTIIKGLDGCDILYNGNDVSEFFKEFKGTLRYKQFSNIIDILSWRNHNVTKLLNIVRDLDLQNGGDIDYDALIDEALEEIKNDPSKEKAIMKSCFEKLLKMKGIQIEPEDQSK